MAGMNWLFKEEPTHYGFDAFVKDKRTVWSGVRNPLAQKHLRAVRKGDRIFYYHTGDEKAVVGIAKAGVIPGAVVAAMLRCEFYSMKISRRAGAEQVRSRPAIISAAPPQAMIRPKSAGRSPRVFRAKIM